MQPEINHSDGTTEVQWTFCPNPATYCPIYRMGAILGSNIQDILAGFIEGAKEGARLTLQKNAAGFTVQVVGTVGRNGGSKLLDSAGHPAPDES